MPTETMPSIRYDLDVHSSALVTDLNTFSALMALGAKWQYRNSAERCKRFAAEATGPQVLA